MKKYQLTINAENEKEALSWVINKAKNNEIDEKSFEKLEKPINWYDKTKEIAKDIFEENKIMFDKVIKEEIKNNKTDFNEIYDEIYQSKDLIDICHQWIEGSYFIYNNWESLKETIDCIKELYNYEETDNGLWEGLKTMEEIINAKAFWTLRNAIVSFLEEELKNYIQNKIDKNEESKKE